MYIFFHQIFCHPVLKCYFAKTIFSLNSVETSALVRNVEDLAAAKSTPIIPVEIAAQHSREIFSSRISGIASSRADDIVSLILWLLFVSLKKKSTLPQIKVVTFVLQSASSEILLADQPRQIAKKTKLPRAYEKKMCYTLETYGIKACYEIESRSAIFLRYTPIYAIVGKHAVKVEVTPGK